MSKKLSLPQRKLLAAMGGTYSVESMTAGREYSTMSHDSSFNFEATKCGKQVDVKLPSTLGDPLFLSASIRTIESLEALGYVTCHEKQYPGMSFKSVHFEITQKGKEYALKNPYLQPSPMRRFESGDAQ